MRDSLLILGRQPALGLAELESLYSAGSIKPIRSNIAGLKLPPDDVDFLRLGGSTRLAVPLTELPASDWTLIEKFFISAVLDQLHFFKQGKIKIGVSAYGFSINPARLTATTLKLKKAIREKGRSVRIVPNQTLELNTAQLEHNGLVRTSDNFGTERAPGCEYLLIATGYGKTILARTILAQDIRAYTIRDRERPKRDARVGMLPPKLAQIIVNLAAGKKNKTVLDPFCGTGVVLQESLLMDHSTYGTDIDKRMIEYSNTNLNWLAKDYGAPCTVFKLEVGDATTHVWQPPIDCVASETYLGQPFSALPSPEKLEQVRAACDTIIAKFLINIGRQLQSGTRLCLGVPSWQTAPGKFQHLPLIDRLDDLGYNRHSFEHVRSEDLLYYREAQIVARELLVLTKQ